MIKIHWFKKVGVQRQILDYFGQPRVIHITWRKLTLRGLFRYLQRKLGGIRRKFVRKRRKNLPFRSIEDFLQEEKSSESTDNPEDSIPTPKNPYLLNSEVESHIILRQMENLSAGYRKVARTVAKTIGRSISHESARKVVRETSLEEARRIYSKSAQLAPLSSQTELSNPEEIETCRNLPNQPSKISPGSGRSQREEFREAAIRGISSRYAALLLLVPYFPQIGFYEHVEALTTNRQKGFTDLELFLTLFYMPFLGCERFEHLDYVAVQDFMPLIGKKGMPGADCIRTYIQQLANLEDLEEKLASLYQGWVQKGLLDGRVIYVDGHSVEYFGKKPLEKVHHGTKNKTVKGVKEYNAYDSLHLFPIFWHFNSGGTKLSTELLDLVKGTEHITGRPVELVIFDRGGNNLQVMHQLQQRSPATHYIAWTKSNYKALQPLIKASEKEFLSIEEALMVTIHQRWRTLQEEKKGGGPSSGGWTLGLTEDQLLDYVEQIVNKLNRTRAQFGIHSASRLEPDRVFVEFWDTQMDVEDLGVVRTILARRVDGTEIGIMTSVPAELLTALEVVWWLTHRWRHENFFRDRINGLAADYLGGWPTISVVIEPEAGLPSLDQLRKRKAKRCREIAKYERESQDLQQAYEDGVLTKRQLNRLQNDNMRLLLKKRKALEELVTQLHRIETAEVGDLPPGSEVVERLRPERGLILASLRDLLYVGCRLLCRDLSRHSTAVLKEVGKEEAAHLSDEYAHLTPARLNRLLFQQGGEITLSTDEHVLTIEINVLESPYWRETLKRYCDSLNEGCHHLKLGRGSEFTMHYSIH